MTMIRLKVLTVLLVLCQLVTAQTRREMNLKTWEFSRDETSWTQVNIPHDWAIGGPFDKKWDLQRVAITQNGETEATEKSGRSGALPWIQATLWQYLTSRYHKQINSDGIKTPFSPVFPRELAYPDAEALPDDEPLGGGYKGGNSYIPMEEYMTYFSNPSAGTVYYPIEIGNKELMKYAKENDGSPNSILCAVFFKALSRVYRDNPQAAQISAKIVANYRNDVGCPYTYRDLVRLLHVKYTADMADWSIEKLSTMTRGSMYLQMQPEFSVQEYKRLVEFRNGIDEQKTFQEKAGYALTNSLMRADVTDTFTVSYVGNISWGGLAEYIESVNSITDGHLMLEVNSLPDKFCISFEQFTDDRKYLDAFLQVLDEEGISYTAGEAEPTGLPGIQLPVPHAG